VGDPAPRRRQELGQQVEAGCLAGAIRADQGMDLPLAHLQVHAFDGEKTLEFLRQIVSGKNDAVTHSFLAPWNRGTTASATRFHVPPPERPFSVPWRGLAQRLPQKMHNGCAGASV